MANDPGGNIDYNLNYNLTVKGQQAIEELNQILQKVEEYKAQARELLQVQPGANIAAVFESIKRAQEDAFNAIKNLPSTIPESDTANRQAALAALAGAEQQYLVDTKALSIAQQELRKEEEAAAQAAKQHYGIATSAAIEYKYQVIQAKEQIKAISTQTGLTQKQVAEGLGKAQVFDPKVINQALRELAAEEKAAAEAAKKSFGDASVAAQAYRDEVEKTKQTIQTLSQQTGLGKADIGKGLVQSGQASSAAVTQALREIEQAEKDAAEAAKKHYGDATAAAQAYRQQVDQAKALIQQLGQQSGQTSKDIAAGLQKAGTFDTKVITAALKEIEAAEKSAQEAAKKHYGDATKATEVYRQSVDAAKTQIQQLAQQSGKSFADVAAGLKQAGAFDPKVITTALKELNAEEKNAAEAAKRHYGDAGAAAQAYRAQIEQVKAQIQALAKQTGMSFQDIGKGMVQSGQASAAQVNQALKELTGTAGGLSGAFSQLGTVGQFVFGSVLGITAIGALRKVIDLMKEAAAAGLEFSRTIFELSASVKLLQGLGMDITLQDSLRMVEELRKEFGIFSKVSLVEAVAKIQLLMRNFEFTGEQMKEVTRLSAALAIMQGKDVKDAARELALFFSSGYAESLQRAGFAVNRVTVAHEAQRMGLIKLGQGYQALSEQERAAAAYSLVMRQAADLTIIATKAQEQSFGGVQRLKSAWTDFLTILGARSAPVIGKLAGYLADLLEMLLNLITAGQKFSIFLNSNLAAAFLIAAKAAGIFWESLRGGKGFVGSFDAIVEEFKKTRDELAKEMSDIAFPEMVDPLADYEPQMAEKIDEEAQEIQDIIKEMNDTITKIEEDAADRRLDIWQDYFRDLEQMEIDHQRKLSDMQAEYQRDLADIDTDEQRDIYDENTDYAYKYAEAVRDSAYRRAEAERKYREQELIAEKRFQEKLRQLREGFLFDLEDALRERDARQVIRLSRQYAMRKGQLEREEGLDKEERRRRFEEELRDIEHQRQEKLRQLAIEHQRRLQDIALQAERERQQAAIDYERKKADEELRFRQEQEDRKQRLAEQLEDLKKQTEDRINEEVAQLLKEKDVVEGQLDPIARAYEDTFGPGGRIDRAIQYYLALLRALGGVGKGPGFGGGGGVDKKQMAEGGTLYADKPTTVVFGEAGPEIATFTPLNKLNKSAKEKEQLSTSTSQSMQKAMSTIKLEMLLSPDLIARVVDKSLEETANVIFEITRTRQH